jgi:hypothetical protein
MNRPIQSLTKKGRARTNQMKTKKNNGLHIYRKSRSKCLKLSKTRLDALGTAESSPGVQNMKTGPDAHGITENESGSAKHENWLDNLGTPEDMKTGPDALGTAENESGSTKHENGTRRPWYRRKTVWRAKHENVTQRPRYCRK